MKITIVRHGETIENKEKILQGHLPGRLTDLGRKQAKRLAERLKDEKIDIIFSSDLARASDTTKEIAKFHPKVPIYFVKELRERYHGTLEGKRREDIIGWEKEENRDKIILEAGSEKIEDFVKRAGNFKSEMFKGLQDKDILWVTHGGLISALNSNISGEEWLDIHRTNPPKNTSVTIFEFNDDKEPKLILMNCIKHLN